MRFRPPGTKTRVILLSLFLHVLLHISAASRALPRCSADDVGGEPNGPAVRTQHLVYRQQPPRGLKVYYPNGWEQTDQRPVLVIFRCNIPFQREHFLKLGMVVVKPQLAPVNSGQLPNLSLEEIAHLPRPRNQVEDAKSVIRFLRANAKQLGIDPDRVVSTGTSGGGDLALQSTINTAFVNAEDDVTISSKSDALILFCPAFDGIDIWFVKTATLLERTKAEASSFLPVIQRFVQNTTDEYAVPRDHRAELITLAATVGRQEGIADAEVERFQQVLLLFNQRDWQLLHPVADALKMSASRILPAAQLPPTMIMFGDRDHLVQYQRAFVDRAKAAGKEFELKIFAGGGHSFMTQPAFEAASTREMESFLTRHHILPIL